MNKIVNKFLLTEDTFMSEMHLRRLGFTCSASWPFTKNKERIRKFQQTGNLRYIYQNRVDKACFQHDMTHGDFKDLPRRTTSDKVWHNKAFNIAKNPSYEWCQHGFASVVYNFFIKCILVVLLKVKLCQTNN